MPKNLLAVLVQIRAYSYVIKQYKKMRFCFFFFAYTFRECGFSEVHITVNSVDCAVITETEKHFE